MGWGRNVARHGLVGLSKLMGFSTLKGLVKRDLLVINYHSIAGADDDPYINRNTYRTAAEFEQDLLFYKEHFNILSPVDIIDLVTNRRPVPRDSLVITFDDGLRINYDIQFPILKKNNVTATFFLCSAFIDNKDLHYGRKANLIRQSLAKDVDFARRVGTYLTDNNIFDGNVDSSLAKLGYGMKGHLDAIATIVGLDFRDYLLEHQPYMDTAQIKEMIDAGFTIGAHSIDHPRYRELSLDDQLVQTVDSMQDITNRFNLDYKLFAFPYSDESLTSEFYERIGPHVDLTFGMGGFVDDRVPFNIQRGEVEGTGLPVAHAMKFRLLLAYLHKISGRNDTK